MDHNLSYDDKETKRKKEYFLKSNVYHLGINKFVICSFVVQAWKVISLYRYMDT